MDLALAIFFGIVAVVALAVVVFGKSSEPAGNREAAQHLAAFGPVNPTLVCPHCQKTGRVRTKEVKQKKGISGAKATGAVLTGGLSMLATGLSRKEALTEAHCDNCGSTWHF